jgi:hypothetical protein
LINFVIAGIIAGLISTGIMTIYEIPFWKLWGIKGILEWHENQIIGSKILKKFKRNNYHVNYTVILLLHIINGVLAAIVFPFVNLIFSYPSFSNRYLLSIIYGIIYGILLWMLTLLPIHKPITGLSIRNHPLGNGPSIVSFSGHILYGTLLGTITSTLLL